jgi:hypothetical protein
MNKGFAFEWGFEGCKSLSLTLEEAFNKYRPCTDVVVEPIPKEIGKYIRAELVGGFFYQMAAQFAASILLREGTSISYSFPSIIGHESYQVMIRLYTSLGGSGNKLLNLAIATDSPALAAIEAKLKAEREKCDAAIAEIKRLEERYSKLMERLRD